MSRPEPQMIEVRIEQINVTVVLKFFRGAEQVGQLIYSPAQAEGLASVISKKAQEAKAFTLRAR